MGLDLVEIYGVIAAIVFVVGGLIKGEMNIQIRVAELEADPPPKKMRFNRAVDARMEGFVVSLVAAVIWLPLLILFVACVLLIFISRAFSPWTAPIARYFNRLTGNVPKQ